MPAPPLIPRVGPGRPFGSKNKAPGAIKAFARGMIESEEYAISLRIRIIEGTLAPAVECLLYHYAYGKPKESVEIKQVDEFTDMTPDAIRERSLAVANVIELLRDENNTFRLNEAPVEPNDTD